MCVCGGGGGAQGVAGCQHPDRQCTRQQNHVLVVPAHNHSSNVTVNQCGAGWEALRVLEAAAMRIFGWGVRGGGAFVPQCKHKPLHLVAY